MTHVPKKRRTDKGSSDEASFHNDSSESEPEAHSHRLPSAMRQNKLKNGGIAEDALRDMAVSAGENEHKSNVFRMETEEMLAEVRLNVPRRMELLEKTLRDVKAAIDGIPDSLGKTIADVKEDLGIKRIYIPFPEPRPQDDVKYTFSYAKPVCINIAGSYALQTAIKEREGTSVDLIITMPSSIFQAKDYLNYRYFHKRAYYLAVVTAALRDSENLTGLRFSFDLLHGDHLRPLLLIAPPEGSSDFAKSRCTIRLLPGVSPDTFTPSKLLLHKNCIRRTQTDDAAPVRLPATPLYNSSLVADTVHLSSLTFLHATSAACSAFKDACILGRVWLRQRGFGSAVSMGGFGHSEWAMVMALLLQSGGAKGRALLTNGYSKYQMLKATLQFLATRDLVEQPLVLNGPQELLTGSMKGPTLLSGQQGLNVLFKMSLSSYKMLKHEAKLTLNTLNNTVFHEFDAVFLHRADMPYCRFDFFALVPIPTEQELKGLISPNADDTNPIRIYARKIYEILVQGLGNRAFAIHITQPITGTRNIYNGECASVKSNLIVGFLLNPKYDQRIVDRGPPPEDKKAAAFRKFWGPKAELRKFADGNILESVVWNDGCFKDPVVQQIIQYVARRYLGDTIAECITFVGNEFLQQFPKLLPMDTQTTAKFQPVMTAFDQLEKDLRNLPGLPLEIRRVAAAGSALRYSSVQIPLLTADALMEPADVVVQFESSGRWPDDLIAIQKTKLAFLLKIGDDLERSRDSSIVTRVGIENENISISNNAFLDVFYINGPSFRLRIYHDREATLLERRLLNPELTLYDRQNTESVLAEHRRLFLHSPQHTMVLQRLSHSFPALSPTIRLVKKWFGAQLLSCHVPEELIELLVARCFLSPAPWDTPASIMSGFFRTLTFLARWDWRLEPLIIDLSRDGELKTIDIEKARKNFDAARRNDPGMNYMAIFVATNNDPTGTAWTGNGWPMKMIAARITALADLACESVKRAWMERTKGIKRVSGSPLVLETLFTSSYKEYDFVLHLDQNHTHAALKKKGRKAPARFKNLNPEVQGDIRGVVDKLGLDPVQYFLNDLQNTYDDCMVLFWDGTTRSNIIGGVWKANTVPRKWKVNVGYSTIPRARAKSEESTLHLNKMAILHELTRLGGEIIVKVETQR